MFGKAGEEIERGMSWHAVEAVEKDVRTCAYLHFLRESSRIRKHILRNRHQAILGWFSKKSSRSRRATTG